MADLSRFGRFEVRLAERQLLVDGKPTPLGARAFDVLEALIELRDRVVTKNELLERVWPGLIVEENNLQVQVSSLRKVLGAQAIATVPGRGYRFVAPARDGGAADARGGSIAAAADVAAPWRHTNLPATIAPLFGRTEELALLGALVDSQRLVTVVGAGGIGKSRLAQAAAHSRVGLWPDGVWMIELAGVNDPDLLPHVVARPLGVNVPEREAGLQVLADVLAPTRMLLVIDNCEHLLDAVAEMIRHLLKAVPALHVLVTSQEPLRLEGEQQYRINPLAVPRDAATPGARDFGALAMFEACVRAADPRHQLREEDLPLAIRLCQQLDGLPLAIELAAARVPVLGLRAVHDRLRERFRLLTGGSRAALRRHQTLRAALEWSDSLLDEAQRAVFRRLGAFSGGFTVELAQALCADAGQDDWVVLDQLSALVEKSLVVADLGEPVRYRLLESARAFALEQLAAAGETASAMRQHATVLLNFLRRADDGNMDSTLRTGEYAALVLPELDNLRAAYAWAASEEGDRAVAIALAAHAGPLIDYSMELAEWLLAQRPYMPSAAVDAVTTARFWRAMAAQNMQGIVSYAEMLDAAQRATAAYRALRWPRRLFSALRLVAIGRMFNGDIDGARAAIDEARALIEPDWGAEFRIVIVRFRARLTRLGGDLEAALKLYREARRLAQDAGDWRLEVIERVNVADTQWEMGQHGDALRELDELLGQLRARPVSDFELVDVNCMRMTILGDSGRIEQAATAAREALPILRRMPRFPFPGCAQLMWKIGNTGAAARVLGAHIALERAGLDWPDPNQDRTARELLAEMQSTLPAHVLTAEMSLGATLRPRDVCALLAEALAESSASDAAAGQLRP